MLRWAEDQLELEPVDSNEMEDGIKESWFAVDCPLCKEYGDNECRGCPIQEDGECCMKILASPWRFVAKSPNWGVWVANATLFIDYLKWLLSCLKIKDGAESDKGK